MPYKDKRAEIRCLKFSLEEGRYDIFHKQKAKLELKYGQMSNGGFLEYLLVLSEHHDNYENKLKRSIVKKHK